MRYLEIWESCCRRPPVGVDKIRWLESETGTPFRKLDWMRNVRNRIAHGEPVDHAQLVDALSAVTLLHRRLGGRPRTSPRSEPRLSHPVGPTYVQAPSRVTPYGSSLPHGRGPADDAGLKPVLVSMGKVGLAFLVLAVVVLALTLLG